MRFFRQIIRDAASGGVLAGLIAVMLLLQAAISGYAQASMVSFENAVEIICAGDNAQSHTEKKPFDGQGRPCCQAACQIVASITPGLACDHVAAHVFDRPRDIGMPAHPAAMAETPRLLGLSRDVRGSPAFLNRA